MILQSYELYSVQTDTSAEYTIDKIVLNEKETKAFLNQYCDQDQVEIIGFYGNLGEIKKTLKIQLDVESFQNCTNQDSKIVGVKFQNKAILCLIFPDNFYLEKPIDQQTIKLTLFRIFSDLTYHIQLCLEDEIFENWYQGEEIPFSNISLLQAQNYVVSYQNLIHQDIQDREIQINCKKVFNQIPLSLNNSTSFIAIDIFGCPKTEERILFKGELLIFLYDIYGKSKIINNDVKNTIETKLQENLYLAQYQYYDGLVKLLSSLFISIRKEMEKIKYLNDEQYLQEQQAYSSIFNIEFEKKFSQYVNYLIFFGRTNLSLQIFKLSILKQQNLEIVLKLEQSQQQSPIINISKRSPHTLRNIFSELKYLFAPQFQFAFKTNDNYLVIAVVSEIEKETILYQISLKFTNFTILTILKKTNKPVFYYDEKSNACYIFNVANKEVKRITIVSHTQTYEQVFQREIKNDQFLVDQIAYLSITKQFILRLNNNELYKVDEQFKIYTQIWLLNYDNSRIDHQLFTSLISCPTGKYFYLQDSEACNIFDSNSTLMKIIKIKGILKIVAANNDILIIRIQEDKINNCYYIDHMAIILENVNKTDQIEQIENEKKNLVGNPVIDVINGSLSKFGQLQKVIFNQHLNYKFLYLDSGKQKLKQLQNYLAQNSYFTIAQLDKVQSHQESFQNFKHCILSRVPIQLCTIENECLIPLINGFRKIENVQQNIKLEDLVRRISFGYLEKQLSQVQQNVYVIGIIGKQSSGKSYLLNRIFGTRFSVSACRCTNGIWASFAKLDGQIFLIFDCEGLFSSARTSREEQLMLAFIIAISDVTILNQDLNFSRCLTDLMNNLQEIQYKLKGDQLFKGYLYTILRDISNYDNQGVEKEFQQSLMNKRQGNVQSFLKYLFNNEFKVYKLTNYEQQFFEDQINVLRKQFIQESFSSFRWKNGEQLVSIMKIVLCQLEVLDTQDSSVLLQQDEFIKIIKICKVQWCNFLTQYAHLQYQLQDTQLQVENFNDQAFKELQLKTIQGFNQKIREKLTKELMLSEDIENYNENLKLIKSQFEQVLKLEKDKIKSNAIHLINNLAISEENQLIKQKQIEQLDFFLQEQVSSLTFCSCKCQQCFLNCSQFKIHFSNKENMCGDIFQQIISLKSEQNDLGTIENDKTLFEFEIQLDNKEAQLQNLQHLIQQYQQVNEKLNNLIVQFPQEIQYDLRNQCSNLNPCELSDENWKVISEKIKYFQIELQQQLENQRIISNSDEFETLKTQSQTETQEKIEKINEQLNLKHSELVDEIFTLQTNSDLEENQFYLNYACDLTNQLTFKFQERNQIKQKIDKFKISHLSNEEFLNSFQILSDESKNFEGDLIKQNQEINTINRQIIKQKNPDEKIELQIKLQHVKKNIESIQILQQDYYFLTDLTEFSKEQLQQQYQIEEQDIIANLNQKQQELQIKIDQIQEQIEIASLITKLLKYKLELENIKNNILKQNDLQSSQQYDKRDSIKNQLVKISRVLDNFPLIIEIQSQRIHLFQQIQQQNNFENLQDIDLMQWFNKQIEEFKKEKAELWQKKQKYIYFNELEEKILNLKEMSINKESNNNTDHSCQRNSHICSKQCCQCQNTSCAFQTGHQGEHLCNINNHFCNNACSVYGCIQSCTQNLNHESRHVCNNVHLCNSKCQYCPNTCQTELEKIHGVHLCNENQCIQKCYLCKSQCKEKHNHSLRPNEEHICSLSFHICQESCQEPGVCTIDYSNAEKEYELNSIQQKYQYTHYSQIPIKQKCSLSIQNGKLKHDGSHLCKPNTPNQFHFCGERCPDCSALCTNPCGHRGMHKSNQHRNKDSQRYTVAVQNIQDISVGSTNKFFAGVSAKLETCQMSCERQGKNHFHLIQCRGNDLCLEIGNPKGLRVRHSKEKYAGFQNLDFDEIVCQDYWIFQNWDHPINNIEIQNEINSCSYYCSFCCDQKNVHNFCTSLAWHTYKTDFAWHQFPCKQKHQNEIYTGINICFVIDSTSSMQDYFDQTIKAIDQILVSSKNCKIFSKNQTPVQFSIVSYKDHSKQYEKQSWLSKKIEKTVTQQDFLTDHQKCINFLKKLKPDGGDDYPEAVLDGLNAALNLKWQEKFYKIIYLIADSPPHGTSGKNGSKIYHHFEDNFPNGCPCRLNQTTILQNIRKKDIHLKIIKLNNQLDIMIAEFEKDYCDDKNKGKIQSFMITDINQYANKIVDDFCRVVQNLDATFKK